MDFFAKVVTDAARRSPFHPVCDYLDGLQWDGVPRLDGWLPTYGGAPATHYTRAVGALMLVAAARRVRPPGVKFDEMLVDRKSVVEGKRVSVGVVVGGRRCMKKKN